MRKIWSGVLLIAVTLSGFTACAQPDAEIIVRDDLNVSLVSAAFEISPQGFANWGDPGFVRPEANSAVSHFGDYRDHEAVTLVGELTASGFWLDRLLRFALEAPAFDDTAGQTAWPEDLAQAAGGGDARAGAARLDSLYQALSDFYHDTNAASWLVSREADYACAIAEIEAGLPAPDFIAAMEAWYGEERAAYELIIAPGLYATMGFGVQYGPDNAPRIANIAAPFVQTNDEAAYGCGYDDPDTVTELSRHEFGHSFVDVADAVAVWPEAASADLHAPIAERMQQQGYASWPVIVEEHIVRLGEIRIAEQMGEPDRAARLRDDYTSNRGFIYLPALEAAIETYEADRERWPRLADFMPELVAAVYASDTQD